MDNNQYLIPANTKNGKLIFSLFRPFDLMLFGSGLLVTLILLAFSEGMDFVTTLVVLSPALITGFLVMPVPNYHNMLVIIVDIYQYLTNRQRYKWKGWCYRDVTKEKK